MTDQLESRLSAAFAVKLQALPPEREARLRAFDYGARTGRRNKLVALIGSSTAAMIGSIVAAILLLSSGAPAAYAGWTTTPSAPSAAAVTAATAACNSASTDGPVVSGQPILADSRGAYTAAVFVFARTTWVCISDGQRDNSVLSMNRLVLTFYAAPGPDQLGLPAGGGGSAEGFGQPTGTQLKETLQNLAGSDAQREALLKRGLENHLTGLAGKDVTAVSFIFAGGTTVDATVQHGWYFAWWPGSSDPTSVDVTTASGSTTSAMPSEQCQAGSSCSVFAGAKPLPGP